MAFSSVIAHLISLSFPSLQTQTKSTSGVDGDIDQGILT